jgi:hypothetical protein
VNRPPLPSQQLRRSDLSAPRQQLLDVCRRIGFGYLPDLPVVDGEPVLSASQPVVIDYVFGKPGNGLRPRAGQDFLLKAQATQLFGYLDQLQNCVITRLVVQDGLPFRMFVTTTA